MRNASKTSFEEFLLMLGVTLILLGLFWRMYINLSPSLDQTESDYAQGRSINLKAGTKPDVDAVRRILQNDNYYTDEEDIDLIADSLANKVEKASTLDNLGAINSREFSIVVPKDTDVSIGGKDFKERVRVSRQRLGFDSTAFYQRELTNPNSLSDNVSVGKGEFDISGNVVDLETGKGIEGVLVQLQAHGLSSLDEPTDDKYAFARTTSTGLFTFKGLARDSGYSVLPLKPGFEFGSRQGTDSLYKSLTKYTFKARPHKIRLIGQLVYDQLKETKAFTVRTPAEFKSEFIFIVALLIASFWGVYAIWSFSHLLFRTRRFDHDEFILPILMLLMGISILTLLSIQDPLQDTLFARQMAISGAAGLFVMLIISLAVNVGRFYTSWKFDLIFTFYNRIKLGKKVYFSLKGWTWLIAAILLAGATWKWGGGPEGSGVNVNLSFFGLKFQPSEVTKYLLLIFFAGFFAANETYIRNLSDAWLRLKINFWVLAGTVLIMLLYYMMGDMGPALVVCLTFLLFYSFARNNLTVMLIAGGVYSLILIILLYWLPTGFAIAFTLISVLAVVIYMFLLKPFKVSRWVGWLGLFTEAPIILIMIIAVFAFGDKIGSVGSRLTDRKRIWLNKWDNNVFGGDHLAHSYWTLSSGSFSGKGIGKGFASSMPAAHTDMILPSIGEDLGWLGLISVLLIFIVLLHRIFLIARWAGQSFSFYLCAGISFATGIQFLLIAGGAIGVLPLTGVAVPFLSFGSTALLINLAAMGLVFSISNRPGENIQQEHNRKHYELVSRAWLGILGLGIVVLAMTLFYIQVYQGREYIVKTARVVNRNGLPMYVSNPRIRLLTRQLMAGNLYDRKGRILATSDPKLIEAQKKELERAGLKANRLEQITSRKLDRYYPFEEQTFFWIGDFNTRLLWSSETYGYFAEERHLSDLRGFNTHPQQVKYEKFLYKENRFSKPIEKSKEITMYDYSVFADMLRSNPDSKKFKDAMKELKGRNRNIKLSIDAALQVALQNALAISNNKDKRISVVVLDAATGDVLASALNPLPNLQNRDAMLQPESAQDIITKRDLGMTYATAPGSTVKILTAAAAFNKLGLSADTTYRDIHPQEVIYEGHELSGTIDMKKAIVSSSNVYFSRLANEKSLDNEMADLYFSTGMNINQTGGYLYGSELKGEERENALSQWQDLVFAPNRNMYWSYSRYNNSRHRMGFSQLAWGQGKLTSTPAAIARMAAGISNGGIMQPSRYILEKYGLTQPLSTGKRIIKEPVYADRLKSYMIAQSSVDSEPYKNLQRISQVAGKSGSPQRGEIFDGWYVFFAPTPEQKSHTVTCIRIEKGDISSEAVKLASEIARILREKGYLGSF